MSVILVVFVNTGTKRRRIGARGNAANIVLHIPRHKKRFRERHDNDD